MASRRTKQTGPVGPGGEQGDGEGQGGQPADELAASGMDLLAGADLGMGTVAEEPGRHGQHGHVDDPAGPRETRCGRDARGFRVAGSAAAELDGLDDEKQD